MIKMCTDMNLTRSHVLFFFFGGGALCRPTSCPTSVCHRILYATCAFGALCRPTKLSKNSTEGKPRQQGAGCCTLQLVAKAFGCTWEAEQCLCSKTGTYSKRSSIVGSSLAMLALQGGQAWKPLPFSGQQKSKAAETYSFKSS